MAGTKESFVKKAATDLLDRYQAYWFKPVSNGMGRHGVPDIICCYKGKFIGLECKAGKGQPTALQKLEMGRIEAANGLTLVVREDTLELLEDMIRNIK